MIHELFTSLGEDKRYCWFQQVGATCPSSNATSLLQVFFGEKPIGKGMLRSPDLTSLDYFVWGYVKENAFTDNP